MIIGDASGRPVDYEGPSVTLTTGANEKNTANGELFDDQYRLVKELGAGGMGKVYLATDKLGIDFAIKMMRSVNPVKKEDVRRKELFIREVQIAKSLNHDNIVPVRGSGVESHRDPVTGEKVEVPYLVMDYVKDGFTLAQELKRRKPLPIEETIDILRQIAKALDYAHTPSGTRTNVIIHRDVKPDNIILQRIDGKLLARLLDFGISKPQVKGVGVKVTFSDNGGTRAYMAPERLVKTCLPTVAEDIYSFAATAYECLVGNPPVSDGGKDSEIYASITKSWREGTLVRPLPESPFAKAVMRGLALNPEERPKTCMEFFKGLLRDEEAAAQHDASAKGGHFPGFTFALESTEFEWNDDAQKPEVVITPPGKLVESEDFAISYEANRDVGTANVAVVGLARKWSKCRVELPFKIVPRDISQVSVDDIAPLVYSGKPVVPKVRVEDKTLGKVLELDKDYWVKLPGGGKVGESKIQIFGMGNYAGEVEKTFLVMRRDITGADITLLDRPEYIGQPARPGIAVRDKMLGCSLEAGRDYSVEYGDNVEGVNWVEVSGCGNYEGTMTIPFTILPRGIDHATVELPQEIRFDGKPITHLAVKVVDSKLRRVLKEGEEYVVTLNSACKPGRARVHVQGKGHYGGEVQRDFTVEKGRFDVAPTGLSTRCEYDGRLHGIEVKVKNAPQGTKILYARSADGPFLAEPILAVDACVGLQVRFRVEREGFETYSGMGMVEIRPRSVENLEFRVVSNPTYTGRSVCPEFSVADHGLGVVLEQGRDFELRPGGARDVGDAFVTLTGKGNYVGEKRHSFKIRAKSVASVDIAEISDREYDGKPQRPEVSVRDAERDCDLVQGRDYRLEYGNERKVGVGTVCVVGLGNYGDVRKVQFKIVPRDLSRTAIAPVPPVKYQGAPIGAMNVEIRDEGCGYTLMRGKDYETRCEDAGKPGTATVRIVGKGVYCGELTVHFTITEGEFAPPRVTGFSGEYDGRPHGIQIQPVGAPPWTCVSYSHVGEEGPYDSQQQPTFVDAGEGVVWFRLACDGYKPFYGKAAVEVYPRRLTGQAIDVSIWPPMAKEGYSTCPVVKVVDTSLGRDLVQDVDYTLENRNAGREGFGRVAIRGRGNYSGEIVEEFAFRKPHVILPECVVFQWPSGAGEVSAVVSDSESGEFLKPGTDFRLAVWDDHPELGWMTAKVTGCGDYDGEITGRYMKADRRFETLLACFANIPISLQKAGDSSAYLVKLKADVKGRCIELTDLLGCVTVDLNGFRIDSGKRSPFHLVHDEDEMQRLGFSGDFPEVGMPPSEWGDCATNLKIVNSRPDGTSGVYCKCDVLVSVDRGVSWMTAFAVDDGVATGRKVP